MFRFEDPIYLWLLLAVPVLIALRLMSVWKQRKALRRLADKELRETLLPQMSHVRPLVKFSFLIAAYVLGVLMLARPQMGTKVSNEKRQGIETIIALDVSNSMRAEDVAPSRLDKSKMLVEDLVDNFNNDKIGLLVFAGESFVQLPITADYVSAKMFLSSIEPGMVATQGTDIAAAIGMATQCFTKDKAVGKAIILITDGEDHEGRAEEAAKAARKNGIKVYVLGVGNPQGAPIPDPSTGGYMIDRTGNTVMSALNEDMCKQVAQAGGGGYIHVTNNSDAQRQLNDALATLAKKDITSVVYSDFDEQFQAFGILMILCLVIEICIMRRKNNFFGRLRLFEKKDKKGLVALAILLVSVSGVQAQNADRSHIRKGNKVYRSGQYDKAEVLYRKALEVNPSNTTAMYNLGNALAMQQKDSATVKEAVKYLEKAAQMEPDPLRKSQAFHNIGFLCQNSKLFREAIEMYKHSLRLNPSDNETRYNLALCKKQLKDDENDKQNQNNKDKEDKKKDDKQEQKQQNKDQNKDKQKEQQQQKDQMSKENAEQMLNAAIQQEKATQQKMKKQHSEKRSLEKNW